MKVIKISTRP